MTLKVGTPSGTEQQPVDTEREREWKYFQGLLAQVGFDPGTQDGIPGPNTRHAVVQFQQAHQLVPANGLLDQKTMRALVAAAQAQTQAQAKPAAAPAGWLTPNKSRLLSTPTSAAHQQTRARLDSLTAHLPPEQLAAMTVDEAMTPGKDVIGFTRDDTFGSAKSKLVKGQNQHADYPVTDANGRLVDVVSNQYLLDSHPPNEPISVPSRAQPVVIHQGDNLAQALGTMKAHGVAHLPVVDGDGKLVGFLSSSDLLKARGATPTAKAQASPPPAAKSSEPDLDVGASGPAVRKLQTLLKGAGFETGVDGIFGKNTAAQVKAYKESRGLSGDEAVDAATWNALLSKAPEVPAIQPADLARVAAEPADQVVASVRALAQAGQTLGPGAKGENVAQIQQALKTLGFKVSVDGAFGNETALALRQFASAYDCPLTEDTVTQDVARALAAAVDRPAFAKHVENVFNALETADPNSVAPILGQLRKIEQAPEGPDKVKQLQDWYSGVGKLVQAKLTPAQQAEWGEMTRHFAEASGGETADLGSGLLREAHFAESALRTAANRRLESNIQIVSGELRAKDPKLLDDFMQSFDKIESAGTEAEKIAAFQEEAAKASAFLKDSSNPEVKRAWGELAQAFQYAQQTHQLSQLADVVQGSFLRFALGQAKPDDPSSAELQSRLKVLQAAADRNASNPITGEMLQQMVPDLSPTRAEGLASALNAAMEKAHITTASDKAAFLASCIAKTDGFKNLGALSAGANLGKFSQWFTGSDELAKQPALMSQPENALGCAAWLWTQPGGRPKGAENDFGLVTPNGQLTTLGSALDAIAHGSAPPPKPPPPAPPKPSTGPAPAPASPSSITPAAQKQMQALLKIAEARALKSRSSPWGHCYGYVWGYLLSAMGGAGYGNGKLKTADVPRAFAAQFGEWLNQGNNAASVGLKRLNITNPYDAPPGAIVVVGAGSPGCSQHVSDAHNQDFATRNGMSWKSYLADTNLPGDVSVATGDGQNFVNDHIDEHYGGRAGWDAAAKNGTAHLVGVYVPA